MQYSQISALPEPDSYNVKEFRKWLRHSERGSIGGAGEQNTWGPLYEDPDEGTRSLWKQFKTAIWTLIWSQPPPTNDLDLVVTSPQRQIDGFTRWVACYWIPFYENFYRYRKGKKTKAEAEKGKKREPDLEKGLGKVRSKKWVKAISAPSPWVTGR